MNPEQARDALDERLDDLRAPLAAGTISLSDAGKQGHLWIEEFSREHPECRTELKGHLSLRLALLARPLDEAAVPGSLRPNVRRALERETRAKPALPLARVFGKMAWTGGALLSALALWVVARPLISDQARRPMPSAQDSEVAPPSTTSTFGAPSPPEKKQAPRAVSPKLRPSAPQLNSTPAAKKRVAAAPPIVKAPAAPAPLARQAPALPTNQVQQPRAAKAPASPVAPPSVRIQPSQMRPILPAPQLPAIIAPPPLPKVGEPLSSAPQLRLQKPDVAPRRAPVAPQDSSRARAMAKTTAPAQTRFDAALSSSTIPPGFEVRFANSTALAGSASTGAGLAPDALFGRRSEGAKSAPAAPLPAPAPAEAPRSFGAPSADAPAAESAPANSPLPNRRENELRDQNTRASSSLLLFSVARPVARARVLAQIKGKTASSVVLWTGDAQPGKAITLSLDILKPAKGDTLDVFLEQATGAEPPKILAQTSVIMP